MCTFVRSIVFIFRFFFRSLFFPDETTLLQREAEEGERRGHCPRAGAEE